MLVKDCERRLRRERHASRQELEGDHGERVLIRAAAENLAGRLLGRHVERRPEHRARRRESRRNLGAAREAEVGEKRPALRVHQDVPRFDVAVENALGVRVVESRGDRRKPGDRESGRNRPRDAALERAASHERHDQVRHLFTVDRRGAVVEDREHVRMLEAGDETRFPQETLAKRGLGGDGPEDDLHGHGALQRLVLGLPHLGHSAHARFLEEAVAPEDGAGRDRHGCLIFSRSRPSPSRPERGRGPRRTVPCGSPARGPRSREGRASPSRRRRRGRPRPRR